MKKYRVFCLVVLVVSAIVLFEVSCPLGAAPELSKNEKNLKPLRLISLNVWGGHVLLPLLNFIKSHQDIDVYCFQEVYNHAEEKISTDNLVVSLDIHGKIAKLLPNHKGYFRPTVNSIYGISMFVKKDFKVEDEGIHEIHTNPNYPGKGPTHSRILQWIRVSKNHKVLTLVNLHALWNGKGKSDSPARLVQSNRIKKFLDTLKTPVVLCGDFNLRPDTKSLRIVSDGLADLIKKGNITSTRSSLYKKREMFADYVFTSKNIRVLKFEVMSDEVSDHSPLLLEFMFPTKNITF